MKRPNHQNDAPTTRDDMQLVELSPLVHSHQHQQQHQQQQQSSTDCLLATDTAFCTTRGHVVHDKAKKMALNYFTDLEKCTSNLEQIALMGETNGHVAGISNENLFNRKRRNLKMFGSHNSGFESADGSDDERDALLKRSKSSTESSYHCDDDDRSSRSSNESQRRSGETSPRQQPSPTSVVNNELVLRHQPHNHHHHHFIPTYLHQPDNREEIILKDKRLSWGVLKSNQQNEQQLQQLQPLQQLQQLQPLHPLQQLQPSSLLIQPLHQLESQCVIDMPGSRRRLPVKQHSVSFNDHPHIKSRHRRSGSVDNVTPPQHEIKGQTTIDIFPNSTTTTTQSVSETTTPTTNRMGFRLGKRKMLTDKRRFVSNCCLACAMFGIVGMIVETELTMASVYDKSSVYSYMVKTSVTASTVVLLNLILAYYRLQAQLYIVNNGLDDWKVALSWPMVLQATTELVVCSIHPFPGDMRFTWYSVGMTSTTDGSGFDDDSGDDRPVLNGVTNGLGFNGERLAIIDDKSIGGVHGGDFHHPHYGEDGKMAEKRWKRSSGTMNSKQGVEVSIDLLFTFPMFLRFYLIGRVMLLQSRILTDASAVSIGALNKISFNVKFVLKALMTICPGTVLVVFMMTVWIVTSWTLRVCESYHDGKHRNFLNSLWMIAITFLSVGYGDIVPNTYCGRSVAVFTGIMGSGCTALVVAVFARKMELTRAEKHVHNFMIDNQLSKKLKHVAANVLRETWFIYKYTSLTHKLDPFKIRCHQSKFLQAIHSLRDIRSKLRTLSDNANTMMDVSRHLTHSALNTTPTVYSSQSPAIYQQMQAQLSQAITDLCDRQMSTEAKTSSIESSIQWMQDRLESLPNMVMEQLSLDQLMEMKADMDWTFPSSLETENLNNFNSTLPI